VIEPQLLFGRPISEAPSHTTLEALAAAEVACRSPEATSSNTTSTSLPLPRYARPVPFDRDTPAHDPFMTESIVKATPPVQTPVLKGLIWTPDITIKENDFGYVVRAVVPGIRPEDVKAELLPGRKLVITGTQKTVRGQAEEFPELFAALPEVFGLPARTRHRMLPRDRDASSAMTGSFTIEWTLPDDANSDSLRADLKVRTQAFPLNRCILR
jgi:HSP20 family molecular chaperone IbpA